MTNSTKKFKSSIPVQRRDYLLSYKLGKKKFKSSIPVQRQDYLLSWAMIYLKKKQAPTIMPSLLIQTM